MARERDRAVSPGTLVIVGTPIGNLGDLSERAAEALAAADLIACEDTRHTGSLLARRGIEPHRLLSLHEHNEASRSTEILALLDRGATVALVSDAGMPVISDPGARLVAAVAASDHAVTVVPGPCAAVTAYVVSGLAAGRYAFEGFLPRSGPERRERLAAIAGSSCPSVVYEAPGRVATTLADLLEACGGARRVAICRELTKLYEEVWRGDLGEAADRARGRKALGEHVVVVDAREAAGPIERSDIELALTRHLSAGVSRRDAVGATMLELGTSRRETYEAALGLDAVRHEPGPRDAP